MQIPMSAPSTALKLFQELRLHPGTFFDQFRRSFVASSEFNDIYCKLKAESYRESFCGVANSPPAIFLTMRCDDMLWTSIFMSSDTQRGISTVLCHDAQEELIENFQSYLQNPGINQYALHPAFLPALIFKYAHGAVVNRVVSYTAKSHKLNQRLRGSVAEETQRASDLEAGALQAMVIQSMLSNYSAVIEENLMLYEALRGIAGGPERHLLKLNLGPSPSPASKILLEKVNATGRRFEGTLSYLQKFVNDVILVQEWVSPWNAPLPDLSA